MRRITISTLCVLILCLAVSAPVAVQADGKLIGPGDFFPEYRFVTGLTSADAAYLGVSQQKVESGEFEILDMWGDVLILELFNRYCFGCQQGAPIVNQAYQTIASDPLLSTKIRFIGVGVGNNTRTVNDFKDEFNVPFPLVPDPRFGLLDALGNPGGTPYTLIIRRTSTGMMVVDTHFGVHDSAEDLVERAKRALEGDVDELLASSRPVQVVQWVEDELVVPLTSDEIMDRVQASMERAGYGMVGLYTEDLPSGEKVYIGEGKRGRVFSRVISRLPVCDVCHPVHFILTFNSKGQIVDFDAISVTKYWNVEWNEEETAAMRKKLLGLSVLEGKEFDPLVDTISTATMSSTLIFDSVGRSGKIYEELKSSGNL